MYSGEQYETYYGEIVLVRRTVRGAFRHCFCWKLQKTLHELLSLPLVPATYHRSECSTNNCVEKALKMKLLVLISVLLLNNGATAIGTLSVAHS